MYVCICNAVTERELRKAAERHGFRTAARLFEAWQIGPVCGQCLAEVDELLLSFGRAADDDEGRLRAAG